MAGNKTILKKAKVKATTPMIAKSKASAPAATMPSPEPKHARRVWNKARPHRAIESTIKTFADGGQKQYNQKPHLAPGVPNTKATREGYLGPNEKPTKTRGSGGGTYDTEQSAGAGIGAAHGSYGPT
jgi:hypothetical protein